MRIGIDVNGVLRDTIGKFTQVYEKHMIDDFSDDYVEPHTYELDYSGNTELIVHGEQFKYKKINEITTLEIGRAHV